MVVIHPTAVIYPGVQLGVGVKVFPHAVIGGPAEIRGEWIGEGDIIVGDHTVIREHAVIQGPARVGADCYLMDSVHVAHHCVIGDRVTMSPHVTLAGHVLIESDATLGMNSSVHQRLTIGAGAMVGMGSTVTKNVPPYRKWYGVPAQDHGWNTHKINVADLAFAGLEQDDSTF